MKEYNREIYNKSIQIFHMYHICWW